KTGGISLQELMPVVETTAPGNPSLSCLCRSLGQMRVALDAGVEELLVDFEDVRRYREAVQLVRKQGATNTRVLLATPRIQKAGENGYFRLIESAEPDGVVIRNLGAIAYFRDRHALFRLGDFSLNVANPLTAAFLIERGLDRLTISYDLNIR